MNEPKDSESHARKRKKHFLGRKAYDVYRYDGSDPDASEES